MISRITTFSKNLKLGQTVHGLISSLMSIVTLKCTGNGLNYITFISKIALQTHRQVICFFFFVFFFFRFSLIFNAPKIMLFKHVILLSVDGSAYENLGI